MVTTSGSTCISRRATGFQLITTPETTPSCITMSSTLTVLKIVAPALRAPKMRPEAISTESTVWYWSSYGTVVMPNSRSISAASFCTVTSFISMPPPHVPPPGASFDSYTATFKPASARSRAATSPLGPAPTIATSTARLASSFLKNRRTIAPDITSSITAPSAPVFSASLIFFLPFFPTQALPCSGCPVFLSRHSTMPGSTRKSGRNDTTRRRRCQSARRPQSRIL